MRFFCFILAVVTLLLSSAPCCAEDECCNETGKACSDYRMGNHHSEEPASSCSPFMVCGSCPGFVVIAVNNDLNAETVLIDELKITYLHEYPDNYCLEFWQPPKIS